MSPARLSARSLAEGGKLTPSSVPQNGTPADKLEENAIVEGSSSVGEAMTWVALKEQITHIA